MNLKVVYHNIFKVFLLFLFIPTSFTFSQNLASAAAERSGTVPDPSRQVQQLQQLTDSIIGYNLAKAGIYARQAVGVAEESGTSSLQAQAYLLAGKTFIKLTLYDSAHIYLNEAKDLYSQLDNPVTLAEVHFLEGKIYSHKRIYATAMEKFHQALAVWEQEGYELGVGKALGEMSVVYSFQADYDKSFEYGDRSIEIFKKLNEPNLQAFMLNEMAYNYLFTGVFDKALEEANEALDLLKKHDAPPLELSPVYNAFGNIYKHIDRNEDALEAYMNNLALCEKIGYERGVMISYGNIGHMYLLLKDYENALAYNLKGQKMMIERDDLGNLGENYMHTSDAYAGLGDYKSAHDYAWRYNEEEERKYIEYIQQIEGELSDKYETGKREATITLQEQRIDQQATIQWLMGGVAALLAIVLGLLYRGFTQKRKSNLELAKKNAENELLLKEIHHRVKNNLQTISSLLNLQAESINDPSAFDAVQESKNRVASMAHIHQKLYQGENLAAIEMRDYFETIGQAIINSFGAKSENVSLNVDMPELELDVDTAVPIGLITNELVTNSLKYAWPDKREGKISIKLTKGENNLLVLHIADDGQANANNGVPSQGGGFGSMLIQLLTTQLRGQMEKSTVQGTTTVIQFPLRERSVA